MDKLYLSDEAAYALKNIVENANGLTGFSCETWAETNGGGGTCRDSWLESERTVSLEQVLASQTKEICNGYFLVGVKDGVAYIREGERDKHPLLRLDEENRISKLQYATYGVEVTLTVKAVYSQNKSVPELTEDETIEVVARRILEKYRRAFEELAK